MKSSILLLVAALAAPVHANESWPDEVARIEDMRALTPMRIEVPRVRQRGEVRGPVILKVHVDPAGMVQRVVLFDSSGSPAHDEAAMHAMRAMKFAPRLRDGEPVAVTLLVPLHLPVSKHRSRP